MKSLLSQITRPSTKLNIFVPIKYFIQWTETQRKLIMNPSSRYRQVVTINFATSPRASQLLTLWAWTPNQTTTFLLAQSTVFVIYFHSKPSRSSRGCHFALFNSIIYLWIKETLPQGRNTNHVVVGSLFSRFDPFPGKNWCRLIGTLREGRKAR